MYSSSGMSAKIVSYRYAIFTICVLAYLLLLVGFAETSQYSPDSWSYFELAKTFSSDAFYRFNTYRSYFSYDRAASFPLGYPAALAGINAIIGWNPLNAAYLNVVLAFCTFLLVQSIAHQIGLARIASLALATSLVFYPGFLNEVASGRAYPAATTLALVGLRIILGSRATWHLLIGGGLLGASAVVRFDFLFIAWVAMMLLMWLDKRTAAAFFTVNLGFLIGMTPWIVYSLTFFSKIWVSDNSWVAISVNPAYVLDFPARASETLFTDPIAWIRRIMLNGGRLFPHLIEYTQSYPLLPFLLAYVGLFSAKNHFLTEKLNILVACIGLSLMTAPYL